MSTTAIKHNEDGHATIRRLALEALNSCQRDRKTAARLFDSWLLADRDGLRTMIADAAIQEVARHAIAGDFRADRAERFRLAKAAPVAGGILANIGFALPQRSAEYAARTSAAVVKGLGELMGAPLPGIDRQLGAVKPWEVQRVAYDFLSRRKGMGERARYYGKVWAACKDKDKREGDQREIRAQLKESDLRRFLREAEAEEAKATL